VLDQGQDDPRGDAVARPADACGAELLLDHELLDCARRPSPRARPVRHDVPRVDELVTATLLVEALEPGDERAHLPAVGLGLRRQVDRALAPHTPAGQVRHRRRGGLGVDDRSDGGGTPQVDVGVVLPRVADAAVDLHVELRAQVGGRHGQRGGDGRGVAELVARTGGGAGGVPHGCGRQLGRHQHVRAVVLDGLERGDGAPELLSDLGVLAGRLGAGSGDAGRLGGQDRPGQVEQDRVPAGHHVGRGTVERDAGRPSRGVEVRMRLDGHTRVMDADDGNVGSSRHEQDVGQPGAQHDPGVPMGGPAANLDVAAERDRTDRRAAGDPGQEAVLQLGGGGRGEDGAGDDGGGERARGHGASQLLDDDDQLGEPIARPTLGLGDVQPRPAQGAQLVPQLGPILGRRLEELTGGGGGPVLEQEVGGRLGERPMVFGDGDRHG
jgi:hypothetical protein